LALETDKQFTWRPTADRQVVDGSVSLHNTGSHLAMLQVSLKNQRARRKPKQLVAEACRCVFIRLRQASGS